MELNMAKRNIQPFKASGTLEPNWHFEKDAESGMIFCLRTKGTLISTISAVGRDYLAINDRLRTLVQEFFKMVSNHTLVRGPEEQDLEEKFTRAITCDRMASYDPLIEGTRLVYDVDYKLGTGELDNFPDFIQNSIAKHAVGRKCMILQNGFIGLAPRTAAISCPANILVN